MRHDLGFDLPNFCKRCHRSASLADAVAPPFLGRLIRLSNSRDKIAGRTQKGKKKGGTFLAKTAEVRTWPKQAGRYASHKGKKQTNKSRRSACRGAAHPEGTSMTSMHEYREKAIAAAVLNAAYTAGAAALLAALAAGGEAGACAAASAIVDGLRERSGRADRERTRAFHAALAGDGEPSAVMEQLDEAAEPETDEEQAAAEEPAVGAGCAYERIESKIIGMDVDEAFIDSLPDSECQKCSRGRGRRSKLSADQKENLRRMRTAGVSAAEIAKFFGISRQYVYMMTSGGRKAEANATA